MSRYRASILGLAAVALGLASGCRSTNSNCGCEPPRPGLLARMGLRSPGQGRCCLRSGPVIGTTVSSTPITGGGFYTSPVSSEPLISGPILSGPITSGPVTGTTFPDGFGSAPLEGPVLPPYGSVPSGTLPSPSVVPGTVPPMPPAGGFARPTPADPAGRYKY